MDALVIWGEDDHEVRAKALATTYNTTAVRVDSKPKKVKNLDALVFWGHGDTSKFCGLTPDDFLDLVVSLKKLNSNLQTVEILTCNARHKAGAHSDSYTEQLVNKITTKHLGLRFRALPIAVTTNAEVCQFSVLKWHPASSTVGVHRRDRSGRQADVGGLSEAGERPTDRAIAETQRGQPMRIGVWHCRLLA